MNEYTQKHLFSDSITLLADLPYLNRLCEPLRVILDEELTHGNTVIEASGGWPNSGSIFVQLRYAFHRKYENLPDVEYHFTNDPHYWKEGYFSGKPIHILTCRFDERPKFKNDALG